MLEEMVKYNGYIPIDTYCVVASQGQECFESVYPLICALVHSSVRQRALRYHEGLGDDWHLSPQCHSTHPPI